MKDLYKKIFKSDGDDKKEIKPKKNKKMNKAPKTI